MKYLWVSAALAGLLTLGAGREGDNSGNTAFQTEVPAHNGSVILARPTDRSIVLSILWHREPVQVVVSYGDRRTDPFRLEPNEPHELVLTGLKASTRYTYAVSQVGNDVALFTGSFHTARRAGEAFTFDVQADSHLDDSVLTTLYGRTLANIATDQPDFLIDLGDTFMTGKHETREGAARQFLAQRYWFRQAASPLFLVVGNHDGETVDKRGSELPDGLAVWANAQRKRYFPNPVPDAFFSGNGQPHQAAGMLQDYYAWQWGDALFVVLDPYWTSRSTQGGEKPWEATLGKAQYDWLAATLRGSTARYRFVLVHQLVGGLDSGGRGGAEAALLYEWGGRNRTGVNEFAARRPGWEKPVHELLVETGVQIVFHGHDHFFACQQRDGIVYQLVPQPDHRNFRNHQADDYGYVEGTFLPNSGHLRISVAPEQTTVEYIHAGDSRMIRHGIQNGQVAFRYTCPPLAIR